MDEIQDVIRKILVGELFVEASEDELRLDDGLRSKLGLDSLGFVELRVQCEHRFGIRIPDAEFTPKNFMTIRTVCELVRILQAAGGHT